MTVSPINKSIVDYLWGWTNGKGQWAKLLVIKIVEKNGELSEDDRREVYSLFLHNIGLEKLKDVPEFEKPSFETEITTLKLLSLEDVVGVNRLAENTPLEFSDNITVIYGGNGTGKTGYVRILKSLGFGYYDPCPILQNVFDEDPDEPSATISYELDGEEDSFEWSPGEEFDDLRHISVFGNDCVLFSIEAKRPLIVSPSGFGMFSILTRELGELEQLNNDKISGYDSELDWKGNLHEGTTVEKFIAELDYDSSLTTLKKISDFTEKHEKKLLSAEIRLSKLNRNLLEMQINSLSSGLTELERLVSNILEDEELISTDALNDLVKRAITLNKLKKRKRHGLSDIAKKKGIELYESEEFEELIEAVERYLDALEDKDYPKYEDAICVYCQQPLDEEAIKLLASYRRVLNDDTQEQIEEASLEVSTSLDQIRSVTEDHYLHYPTFGKDKDGEPIQPLALTRYNAKICKLKKLVGGQNIKKLKENKVKISSSRTTSNLSKKADAIRGEIANKAEQCDNLEAKEDKLKTDIQGLQDRKLLSAHKAEVQSVIERRKIIKKLEKSSRQFSSTSVSRQTTLARKELIADEFKEAFLDEYRAFRRSDIDIDLGFRTDKGESTLIQGIGNSTQLKEVLSEGEQKAIALAEFLAELRFDNAKAPVIFDDPVTSLDHHIIDAVARRLVKLSRSRQVIIFTHSILMFNSIRQRNSSPSFSNVQFRYYQITRDTESTGFLEKNPSPKEETFKHYQTEINNILALPKEEKERYLTELSIRGYGLLRSGIEAFVERDMLRGVVKRYARNVALMALERVNGKLIEKYKNELNEIYERCCQFIEGHTNPEEVSNDPDLALLEQDFKKVREIRKEFV